MCEFYNDLEHRYIYLRDAPSIVITSFISHKTVSHLDLQLIRRPVAVNEPFSLLADRGYCGTEENLRNHLVPERRLLYTLHLDLPVGSEYSHLRSGLERKVILDRRDRSLHVAVVMDIGFYETMLSRRLEAAFEQTKCQFKLLKWMVDFRRLNKCFFIPGDVQLLCANVLYRECADSEFTMEFLAIFRMLTQLKKAEEVKVLEYLLYHAKRCGFDLRTTYASLSDRCITHHNFRIVPSVLNYEITAYYTDMSYRIYKDALTRRDKRREEMKRPENWMSKPRLFRMLQILFIYHGRSHPSATVGASEALRSIWSSIPDSFVCLEEFNDAYEDLLDSQFLSRAHSFYEEAIGQTVSCREPRSLSQYCRCAVRKNLNQRKQWLPDVIKQLPLPTRLESYLNL